jgi:hypothetical protein
MPRRIEWRQTASRKATLILTLTDRLTIDRNVTDFDFMIYS